MENAEENMNCRKSNSLPLSLMPVLSQVPRTPLMDVKNRFRSKARQRMSTGSMKSSDHHTRHRLSLCDQETIDSPECYAKFCKPPNDIAEGEAELKLPIAPTPSHDAEGCIEVEEASALFQPSCDISTFADTVDENILHEKLGELSMGAEEISADGEFLKDIMSVLDQDMYVSDNLIPNPIEPEESFCVTSFETSESIDYSNVESTEQILSDIQAIELEQTLEGTAVEFEFDSVTKLASINQIDVAQVVAGSQEESNASGYEVLGNVSNSEQDATLLEQDTKERLESLSHDGVDSVIESDSEPTFLEASDVSNGHLSSSFRESGNNSGVSVVPLNDFEIVGDDMHELSSIRLVDGNEDSILDALIETTLTEDKEGNDHHVSHPNIEGIAIDQEKGQSKNEDGTVKATKHLAETANDSSDSLAGSLLVDLSISEAEVMNCFDCTADMSTFIDEFLKETPVVEHRHHRPERLKPQTLGKRDDLWPGEKDSADDLPQEDLIKSEQSVVLVTEEKISNDDETQTSHSSENNPLVQLVVDGDLLTNEQLLQEGEGKKVAVIGEDEDNVKLNPGDDLLHGLDSELIMSDGCENLPEICDGGSSVNSEFALTKSVDQNSCESAEDVYSFRVTKVLETLRKACLTSNVEGSVESNSEVPKHPSAIKESEAEQESKSEVDDELGNEVTSEFLSSQVLPFTEEIEFRDVAVSTEKCDTNEDSSPNHLEPVSHSERVYELSDNLNSTDDSETSSSDTNSINGDASEITKEKPSLNRSTVEMKEEIHILETQMAEMKLKVAWLESQIESDIKNDEHVQQRQESAPGCELKNEAMDEKGSESQLDEKKRQMYDLENRLSEELQKTQNLEGHVKDVEMKCSLLEKERLNSELNFARELKRLKVEYTQSINQYQTEEEEGVEVMNQEFDCMMLEFERLTLLQKKLKDMLNRVMRTTNESLTGYAKLLKDYSELQQKNQSVETHISTSKVDNKKLVDDVEVLENLLQRSNDSIKDLHQLYQEEIENLKSQVASLSEAQVVAAEEKEATKKGLEDHVEQLQESLDRLETERHRSEEELEDMQFLLDHQKAKNQTLSEEVDELRKVKADWLAGQDLIKELQDTISFLNEEKEVSDADYAMTKRNREILEDEVKTLMLKNEEYQSSHDQLQTEVSGLREKLFMTGEDVTMMLATLENIESMSKSLVDTLQQKFGVESKETAKTTPKQATGPSSLVAQILSRVGVEGDVSTSTNNSCIKSKSLYRGSNADHGSVNETSNEPSSTAHNSQSLLQSSQFSTKGPSSRKALSFSSPSPHSTSSGGKTSSQSTYYECSMAAATCQDSRDGGNSSVAGFAHIRTIPLSGKKHEKEDRLSVASDDLNILEVCESMLETIEQKYSMILKIVHTTDRTFRIKVRDLKGEVELLSEKWKMKRDLSDKLDTELDSKRRQLAESRDENEQLNERVNRMTQAILKHEDMTYDLKRLQDDNVDLHQELSNVKGERDMLSSQVQDLIAKASGGEGEQASLKKIAALEKKIYQLNRYMLQEQEKTTEKGDKAMRRIRVLEMNLKRAEEEVYKFDELVEAIRNTCIENRGMRPHPVLLHVVRLIDGLVEVEKKQPKEVGRAKDTQGSTSASTSMPTSSSRSSSFPLSSHSSSTRNGKKVEEYRV